MTHIAVNDFTPDILVLLGIYQHLFLLEYINDIRREMLNSWYAVLPEQKNKQLFSYKCIRSTMFNKLSQVTY